MSKGKSGSRRSASRNPTVPQRFMLAASRGLIGRIAYFVQEAATLAVSLGLDRIRA